MPAQGCVVLTSVARTGRLLVVDVLGPSETAPTHGILLDLALPLDLFHKTTFRA